MNLSVWLLAVILIIMTMLLPSISQSFAQTTVAPPKYILSVPKLTELHNDIDLSPHGETRMMTTTFINNDDKPVRFIVFLEIRDSKGITVFLQFHMGAVEDRFGYNTLEVASSWLPEKEGVYELRTFALGDFAEPEVLVCCAAPVNVTIN